MILIRHAQSEWNQHFSKTRIDPGIPDPALTDIGRQQAESLIDRLSGSGLVALVASPYRRALETADIVASALGLPITVNTLIRERCVFSCDIGSHPDVLSESWPDVDFSTIEDGWWGVPPETEADVLKRSSRFRDEHEDLLLRDDVAVISHWGFIRALTGEEVENAAVLHVGSDGAVTEASRIGKTFTE
jgi:broad specificity phosphatase PhoE